MTTCHSQFFDFTKLFSSFQTQVISFLAFKFSPIIAEVGTNVLVSRGGFERIKAENNKTFEK
jgi:hypothetical protein